MSDLDPLRGDPHPHVCDPDCYGPLVEEPPQESYGAFRRQRKIDQGIDEALQF